MSSPHQGRIVWVAVLDSMGRNPKTRPVVIIATPDDIAAGGEMLAVAITTSIPDPVPPECVELPWSRPRHPRTGLNQRCAANCSWVVQVRQEDIQEYLGIVPPRYLNEILTKVDQYGPP